MAEWERLEAKWAAGGKSSVARWVPGRPVRTSKREAGGGRFFGMTPEPVLWSTWEGMVASRRNVRVLLFEYVDAHGEAVGRVGQRAEPPSPMSMTQARSEFGSVAPSEEDNGVECTYT